MGDFKDASLWMKVAFLMITIGFLVDLFSYVEGVGAGFGGSGAEACFVIGFLCFVSALVLGLAIIFLDELKGNKPASICFIIFSLIAGIITVIGIAIWGGDNNRKGAAIGSYSTMHGVIASLMAILAGIFAILDIAGVKSK